MALNQEAPGAPRPALLILSLIRKGLRKRKILNPLRSNWNQQRQNTKIITNLHPCPLPQLAQTTSRIVMGHQIGAMAEATMKMPMTSLIDKIIVQLLGEGS